MQLGPCTIPLLRQIHTRNAAREAAHGVRPEDVLPVLNSATVELRMASVAALDAVCAIVELLNTTRWRRAREREVTCAQALEAAAVQLRTAIAGFEATGQGALFASFLPVFQDATAYKLHFVLEAEQFIFKYVLISIAKLWLPAVFKHSARKFILANKGQLDQYFDRPFTTSRRESGKINVSYYSAWVQHKSFGRALIMAQTTLNIYAADQIFKCVRQQLYCSVVLKPLILLVTLPVYWVLSSVLQLVCWRGMRVSRGFVFTVGKSNNPFPGNGKGDGSP
jgi:hypothetical protein